ncbi:MAG: ubiquinone/menaquinone biosynthesis methyltransferase [Bacteroidia bacterium]|nr:MAG: ubiquinone/menaquinone biosynthesis methyltransferase [Bacteroidia bacterium]
MKKDRKKERESAVRPLQKMFTAVPPSYDLINRLITFRFDERWRNKAAAVMLQDKPGQVLDLCTGSGDLAMHLHKRATSDTAIYALDYSEPMLELARQKAGKRGAQRINFLLEDAAAMPFENDYFDVIGIAFAFRNLTFRNPDKCLFLNEILRILKPGGKFVIVETSQPSNMLLQRLFHFYMRWITVPLGGMLSGQRHAYHYLAHSAIHFYSPAELIDMMKDAGFDLMLHRPYFGGISAIWAFKKPV